ncbi:MAG: hypothetical protein ACRDFX_01130 [Chloroflexota bacterium]
MPSLRLMAARKSRPGSGARVLGLCSLMLLIAVQLSYSTVRADGLLPAQPYRYLHPPPALQSVNVKPLPGLRVLPLDYLHAETFGSFTPDGQAGITAGKNAFKTAAGTTAVVIHILPVETPPGLPPQVALDGNSYSITATEQPSNLIPVLSHGGSVVMRWPHLPLGIYQYRSGNWKRVCYSNTAVISSNTILCPIKTLGTFAAVTSPSNVVATAAPHRSAGLTALEVAIIIAGVVVVALLVAIVVRPPRRRGRSRKRTP